MNDTNDMDEMDDVDDANDMNDANDGGAPRAQAVLEHIVESVVETPEAVRVVAVADGDDVRLDVFVDRADIGRVIGRRGRVAGAIRTVVRAAAVNDGCSVSVDFVEP